ncbi:MAG: hypothetical protein V4792_00705 [Pseudomonadota bacterium]
MTSEPPLTPAGAALIDGRSAFTGALRQALSQAARERARELCFVDPDFEAWPLDDPLVLGALTAWARLPKRHLLMIACRFDGVPRRCPRFTVWRRDWAHVVECRATEIESSQVPTLLLAGAHSLQLADRLQWRGHWLADDSEISAWREVVDVLMQRSEADFPANVLGL